MIINKGKVSRVTNGGKSVSVTPYVGGSVTPEITVPFFLIGALPVNTPVAFVLFDDGTGVVLSRMDGEWNHVISDGVVIDGVPFGEHTHEYICSLGGASQTGAPE